MVIRFVALLIALILAARGDKRSDCETNLPVNFNAPQRALLCANATQAFGPANCAAVAKSMHLSTEDTAKLCAGAPSDQVAQCFRLLSRGHRKAHGMQLCRQSPSALPATCLNTLVGGPFKGGFAVPAQHAAEFCRGIYDVAPLACALAAVHALPATSYQRSNSGGSGSGGSETVSTGRSVALSGPAVLAACADSMIDEWTRTSQTLRGGQGAQAHYLRRLSQRPFWLQWLDQFRSRHSLESLSDMKRGAIERCLQDVKPLVTTPTAPISAAPIATSNNSSDVSGSGSGIDPSTDASKAGLSAAEMLSFCSHANPVVPGHDYFLLLQSVTARSAERRKQAATDLARRQAVLKKRGLDPAADQFAQQLALAAAKKDSPPLDAPRRQSVLGECVHLAAEVRAQPSSPSLLSVRQRLQLCALTASRQGPVNCARHLAAVAPMEASLLITLCHQAGRERQAVGSLFHAFHTVTPGVPQDAQQAELLAVLRQQEQGDGLATAQCFLESRGLGSVPERVELCAGVASVAAAHCYRRAAAVRIHGTALPHADRMLLCVSASSADPAECALSAPLFLTAAERITLCMYAPNERAAEAGRCLAAIDHRVRLSTLALPRGGAMGGGAGAGSMGSVAAMQTRELALHLCSYGGSSEPLAAAECVKRAPASLAIDDALRTCTNSTSADVASRAVMCLRMLRGWAIRDAALLCSAPAGREAGGAAGTARGPSDYPSREASPVGADARSGGSSGGSGGGADSTVVKSVIQCASQLTRATVYHEPPPEGSSLSSGSGNGLGLTLSPWTNAEAAALCRHETPLEAVAACALAARPCPSCTSARNAAMVNAALVTAVCASARDPGPGKCLTLAAQSGVTFDLSGLGEGAGESPLVLLCSPRAAPHAERNLICLRRLPSLAVGAHDVLGCFRQPHVVDSARVLSVEDAGGGGGVTAGRRFRLTLELFDAYGVRFRGPSPSGEGPEGDEGVSVRVSINDNNPQGAVLWGAKSNTTSTGVASFPALLVTLPGAVTVRVAVGGGRAVFSFVLAVRPDERLRYAHHCMVLFRQGVCPLASSNATQERADADGRFPVVRTALPLRSHYLLALTCLDVFASWFVSSFASPAAPPAETNNTSTTNTSTVVVSSGGAASSGPWLFFEYRAGIDAIWTGVGLPSSDQTPGARLGLPVERVERAGLGTGAGAGAGASVSVNAGGMHAAREGMREGREGKGGTAGRASRPSPMQRAQQRALKKAYYAKSLLWHPDRWVGMTIYLDVVREAFESVHEAYEELGGAIVAAGDEQQPEAPVAAAAGGGEENLFE